MLSIAFYAFKVFNAFKCCHMLPASRRYAAGLPFVDRPVTVDTLAAAAVAAVEDRNVSGILDFREMERLAANASLYLL
jgi:metallophosphoesterase superfamily enzyme